MNEQSQSNIPVNPIRIKVKPSDTTAIACPCGGEVFNKGALLRKVSQILTGSTNNEPLLFPVFYCVKCGRPAPDSIPDEFKPIIEV